MRENGRYSADPARDVAEQKIQQALAYLTDEVHAGNKPNVAHASRLFGCPPTTLRCRWKGERRSHKEAKHRTHPLHPNNLPILHDRLGNISPYKCCIMSHIPPPSYSHLVSTLHNSS
jgi:hypothetical protein